MSALLTSEAVVRKALSQVGVAENPPYSNRTPYTEWYGMQGPWCAMFVSWAHHHGGQKLPAIRSSKGFAYCPDIVNWAKANRCWRPAGSGYKPKRGDIILFDFIGRPSHVGIVLGMLPDGRVQTVEGNTNGSGSRDGGSVMVHNRSARGTTIGFVETTMVPAPATPAPAKPGEPAPMRPWVANQHPVGYDAGVKFYQGLTNVFLDLTKPWRTPTGKAIGDQQPLAEDGWFGPRTGARTDELERVINYLLDAAGSNTPRLQADGKVTGKTLEYLGNLLRLFMPKKS
ncbi:MAG: CHAP domain-containing protein [Propionicimonas sp.]